VGLGGRIYETEEASKIAEQFCAQLGFERGRGRGTGTFPVEEGMGKPWAPRFLPCFTGIKIQVLLGCFPGGERSMSGSQFELGSDSEEHHEAIFVWK
jgi:hypothetical protein